jgi:hypothetical protein
MFRSRNDLENSSGFVDRTGANQRQKPDWEYVIRFKGQVACLPRLVIAWCGVAIRSEA